MPPLWRPRPLVALVWTASETTRPQGVPRRRTFPVTQARECVWLRLTSKRRRMRRTNASVKAASAPERWMRDRGEGEKGAKEARPRAHSTSRGEHAHTHTRTHARLPAHSEGGLSGCPAVRLAWRGAAGRGGGVGGGWVLRTTADAKPQREGAGRLCVPMARHTAHPPRNRCTRGGRGCLTSFHLCPCSLSLSVSLCLPLCLADKLAWSWVNCLSLSPARVKHELVLLPYGLLYCWR